MDEVAWKQQQAEESQQVNAMRARRARSVRPVVISFGRFNPPSTASHTVVKAMVQEANRLGAIDIILFPSVTQDTEENPMPFPQKVKFLRQLFPGIKVSGNRNIRTPIEAIAACALQGFDAVTLVAGEDRAAEFQKFTKYIKTRGKHRIPLKQFEVVSVPHDPETMTDDQLRKAAREGDWSEFRTGVPTKNQRLAKDLYDTLRRNVGLMERKPVFFLFGTSTKARKTLHEGFTTVRRGHPTVPCYTIKEDASFGAIRDVIQRAERKGYTPTIYVLDAALPAQVNESWMKRQTTCGLLLRQFPKNIIALGVHGVTEAVTHAELMLEDAQTPKQPTEVDRLRQGQEREKLALAQRQGNEILQAKERELQKKSREKAQKLAAPKKPAGQAR